MHYERYIFQYLKERYTNKYHIIFPLILNSAVVLLT